VKSAIALYKSSNYEQARRCTYFEGSHFRLRNADHLVGQILLLLLHLFFEVLHLTSLVQSQALDLFLQVPAMNLLQLNLLLQARQGSGQLAEVN